MQQTMIERIGDWVANLTLDDIPASTQARLRLQVATAVSAAGWTPWHHASQIILKARRSEGNALVFASGDRIAPEDAAFVNAAFAMSFDCDDYMLTGHTGHSSIQVPLAWAENLDQVIVAAAAANEVVGRISTVCLFGPLNGQMSSYIHNIGGAIAWAKVHELDGRQVANALALALYQPNFCQFPGFWHEETKSLTASQPQAHGIAAAKLAAAGLEGSRDILDHPLGFFQTFSFVNFPGLFDGLGSTWFSDTLSYKRYPGTSYISAGVEAALSLSEGRPLQASDIKSLLIRTTILSATLDDIGSAAINRSPLDANAINFSLKLSVAAALHFGDLTPDHLRPERLAEAEDQIRAIADRIEVEHDLRQSLTMLSASSVGVAVLANLTFGQLRALRQHVRSIRKAAGGKGLSRTSVRNGLPAIARMVGQILRARGQRVSDLDFDADKFPMQQSAIVEADLGAGHQTAEVQIPIGACGRDVDEARELVLWRCRQAYGDVGEELLTLIERPGTTVEAIYKVVAQGASPITSA